MKIDNKAKLRKKKIIRVRTKNKQNIPEKSKVLSSFSTLNVCLAKH